MRLKALTRRGLLGASVSLFALVASRADAESYSGSLPWLPGRTGAPAQVEPNGWTYFTPEEVAAIEALVDRLIPSDDLSPGGKDAGIAVYIDRQLSGDFGRDVGLYMSPPFVDAAPNFGPQSPLTPAQRYRASSRSTRCLLPGGLSRQGFRRYSRRRAEQADRSNGKRRPAIAGREQQGVLPGACGRTPRRGSSQTRSMAAIATWWAGR